MLEIAQLFLPGPVGDQAFSNLDSHPGDGASVRVSPILDRALLSSAFAAQSPLGRIGHGDTPLFPFWRPQASVRGQVCFP